MELTFIFHSPLTDPFIQTICFHHGFIIFINVWTYIPSAGFPWEFLNKNKKMRDLIPKFLTIEGKWGLSY
jgi:hypothetical protein